MAMQTQNPSPSKSGAALQASVVAGGANVKKSKLQLAGIDSWPFRTRFAAMKNEGATWIPAWKELSKYENPTRGFFMDDVPNRGKKIDHTVVLDGHARRCIRTLASGMVSGLTSPSRPWFRLGVENKDLSEFPAVREWLDMVQIILADIYSHSNIYGVFHTTYEEIATFGTGCFYVEEDIREVIRGRVFTAGEYYLACGPDGRVNAFAREFYMTAGQMVTKFGKENVSASVLQAFTNNQTDNWYRVNHLIEVNDDRIPDQIDFKNMPFRSLYWEDGEQDSYLRLEGYLEMPNLAPRWETTTTADIYGRGPGWDALGDVKMLQKEQRVKLLALDKVADPPVQVDASVQGDANLLPGGVTRFSAALPNAGVKAAYQVAPDINAMREDIMEVKKAISETFYADLFLLLNQADLGRMTAYEVAERQSEKLVVLGPVLERLENEMLSPFIKRTYAIALRMGLIPPPPREISGQPINIQYVSIMAQAQRMVGATAIQQAFGFGGNLATVAPEVMDNYDVDETVREYNDMLALPAKITRSPEAVARIRKARAEAQAQAVAQQTALNSAKAAKDGAGAAKDLGTTPVGNNSALDATLAAITGSQGR